MVDFSKCSNPTRVAKLEETVKHLKDMGIEEVYIEITDPDNICFTSVSNRKDYAFCYSKNITT